MSKKFSIVKTIDLDKLSNEINDYKNTTCEMNPYIFMNEKTIKEITYDLSNILSHDALKNTRKHNGLIGYFEGYKMFADDTLDFGEVEIR